MPPELILVTLEWAARTWIDVHLQWAASLQLVSRAAHTAIEPIIYRVFTLQTSEAPNTHGQWGQTKAASRLVEILTRGTPRIHHLILGSFTLDTIRRLSIPRRSIPQFSIVSPRPIMSFKPLTNWLRVTSPNIEFSHTGRVQASYLRATSGGHTRLWGSEVILATAMPTYDFLAIYAPSTGEKRRDAAASSVQWLHMELGEWMSLSMIVLYDIAAILLSDTPGLQNAHVVIACPVNYTSAWGLGVDETMQLLDASRELPAEDRPLEEQWCTEQHMSVALEPRQFRMLRRSRVEPDVLYNRVHISHALWGCDGPGWVGSWYGRAVERGDAWDEGRLLRRFEEPTSTQSP